MKKRIIFSAALIAMCCLSVCAQKKMSVLGDSYSTFEGRIAPTYNACWYFGEGRNADKSNDVASAEQTWWLDFARSHGYTVDVNNSYSGSTVCHTGYRKDDYSDRSFITRIHNLGAPDVLFVFGGTNDSWAKSPIGEYKYKNWTKEDLYNFRPAFCYLMYQLRQLYPHTKIYNITNSELSSEITGSMATICKHYGIKNILLHDIDKQGGHPSTKGMKSISEQLWQAVGSDLQKQ